MKNLSGVSNADETILEELYLAGITAVKANRDNGEVYFSYVGKVGKWTFTRRWYYWSASVENRTDGIPVELALEFNERKHPTRDRILGDVIRAGGHAGGISPDDYVGQPVYNEELDNQLLSLGYKKQYNDFLKKEYIPINYGEIARLCNEGKLKVDRYIDSYHIDEQIGLNEFVKFISQNEK